MTHININKTQKNHKQNTKCNQHTFFINKNLSTIFGVLEKEIEQYIKVKKKDQKN